MPLLNFLAIRRMFSKIYTNIFSRNAIKIVIVLDATIKGCFTVRDKILILGRKLNIYCVHHIILF